MADTQSSGSSRKPLHIILIVVGAILVTLSLVLVLGGLVDSVKTSLADWSVIKVLTFGMVDGTGDLGWTYWIITLTYLLIGIACIAPGVLFMKKD